MLGVEIISSNELPNEKAPEEGFSGFGPSSTAVPSPLKEDPRTKPLGLDPAPAPKGFLTSVGLGVKAESVCDGAPNGEAPAGFEKPLSPVAGFEKDESPGLADAKPAKPPPPPPENELKPPPEELLPVPSRLLPGLLGFPNGEAIEPKPDWPNEGCPGVFVVPKPDPG